MSNRRFSVLVLLLASAAATGAGTDNEKEKDGDLSKLQGSWEASVGKRQEFSVSLEVKGHEVSATIKPKKGPKIKADGELQLDEKASPRSLDWVKFATADGIEVPRMLSIYRLEGDKLYVRSGGFNDPRPKAFEAGGEGVWSTVMVFSRPAKTESVSSNP